MLNFFGTTNVSDDLGRMDHLWNGTSYKMMGGKNRRTSQHKEVDTRTRTSRVMVLTPAVEVQVVLSGTVPVL